VASREVYLSIENCSTSCCFSSSASLCLIATMDSPSSSSSSPADSNTPAKLPAPVVVVTPLRPPRLSSLPRLSDGCKGPSIVVAAACSPATAAMTLSLNVAFLRTRGWLLAVPPLLVLLTPPAPPLAWLVPSDNRAVRSEVKEDTPKAPMATAAGCCCGGGDMRGEKMSITAERVAGEGSGATTAAKPVVGIGMGGGLLRAGRGGDEEVTCAMGGGGEVPAI